MKLRSMKMCIALLLAVLLLAACAQPAADAPAPADDTPAASDDAGDDGDDVAADPDDDGGDVAADPDDGGDVAADQEPVTLTFMHTRTDADIMDSAEGRAFLRLSEEWLEMHPHVTIEQSTMGQGDYQTRVMVLAAADDMPDMFFTKGSWVSHFYNAGVMADLTDYIDMSLAWRPGMFDPFTRNGRIYAVPYQCNVTHLIYYNMEMWREAGFDSFPDNWEDIERAHEHFAANGITTISFGNFDMWNIGSCILSALGDRFTGTEWTESIVRNDGIASFTDPEWVASLEWAMDMRRFFNTDFNAIPHQQAATMFAEENAAAHINGIWMTSWFISNASEELVENMNVAVMPGVPGGLGVANATSGGPVWSQSVSARLTGAAFLYAVGFTNFLYADYYNQYVMDAAGQIGPIIKYPADIDALNPLARRTLDFVNSLDGLTPIYDGVMDASVISIKEVQTQLMLSDGISPQEVAELVQAELERLR